MGVIAVLLVATAGLLAAETFFSGAAWTALAPDSLLRPGVAVVAGLLVGAISSLLGVAGGEFIIPILIFVFGADIRTAGTASVLISIPIVLTGVARHWLTGHYRSPSMFQNLILPMALGSMLGAVIGGYLAVWAPTDVLRLTLAVILALSAAKLWTGQATGQASS
jgi:uncharacterized membrane protein YfcA